MMRCRAPLEVTLPSLMIRNVSERAVTRPTNCLNISRLIPGKTAHVLGFPLKLAGCGKHQGGNSESGTIIGVPLDLDLRFPESSLFITVSHQA